MFWIIQRCKRAMAMTARVPLGSAATVNVMARVLVTGMSGVGKTCLVPNAALAVTCSFVVVVRLLVGIR